MICYFGSETALTIEEEGDAGNRFEENADQGAFVEMRVYEVRPALAYLLHRPEEKKNVQIWLVPGRTGRQLAVPGNVTCSYGRNARHIPAKVVRGDTNF